MADEKPIKPLTADDIMVIMRRFKDSRIDVHITVDPNSEIVHFNVMDGAIELAAKMTVAEQERLRELLASEKAN